MAFLVSRARPSVVISLALHLSSLLPCKISPTLLAIRAPPPLRSIMLLVWFFKPLYSHPTFTSSSPRSAPDAAPAGAPGAPGAPGADGAPAGAPPAPPNTTSNRRLQQTQAQVEEVSLTGRVFDIASDKAVCETQALNHLELQCFFWNTDNLTYKMCSSCFPWKHLCLET